MVPTTVRRVDVPSGGWWEIETRPRWRHVRGLCRPSTSPAPETGGGESDLLDRLLMSLTTAWSFGEPVCARGLALREARDVVAVLTVLSKELSLWPSGATRSMAEDLLAALARGRVPREFREAHIMAMTGWSWETLQETPADVVERMAVYVSVQHVRETGGSLDFVEEPDERSG